MLFRAGAQFWDANTNLMGYIPEPVQRSDLYPLVCTIISGDVTKQHAIHDIAKVVDFLENNAHLQGVPAYILQVCAQPQEEATSTRIGGASKTLAMQHAEASLFDLEAVVPDPLIHWPL